MDSFLGLTLLESLLNNTKSKPNKSLIFDSELQEKNELLDKLEKSRDIILDNRKLIFKNKLYDNSSAIHHYPVYDNHKILLIISIIRNNNVLSKIIYK